MFKEDFEGSTFFCPHETENESGVCDKCLGRAEDVIGVEISGTQSYNPDVCKACGSPKNPTSICGGCGNR